MDTTVYPHNRSDWRGALGEGLKTNADLLSRWGVPVDRPIDKDIKSPVFHRRDGTAASLDYALEVAAGDPFVAFLATLVGHDQVDWEPLLDAKLAESGLVRIREARDALSAISMPLTVTWWFARRMADLGADGEAWALGEAAYTDTQPSGWMPRWDGEARMMAAEILVELGGDAARQTVLERFTADYLDEVRYPRDLLRWIGRISALLVGPDAPAKLWPDIAEHVSQLAQVRDARASDVPGPTGADPSCLDPLVRFAWRELADAATEVGDQARRFLVDLAALPQSRDRLFAVAAQELKSPDDACVEHALAFLECVAVVDPSFSRPLADDFSRIVKETMSGSARLQAERLLGRLEIAAPERDDRPLPPVYAIHLPDPPQMERTLDGGPEKGESLRDTTDPMDLTRLLHREVALLSAHTGLGFYTLVHRMASLMTQVSPPSDWGHVAEQAMRRRAESSGMRMGYRRLRSLVALRAFSRLVLELTDGNALEWLDPEFQVWLRPVDGLLNAHDPSPRPSWISYPDAAAMTADEKVWKQAPAEAFSLAGLTAPDGRVIIGEHTTVERLENRRSVEIRATQRGGANFPWSRAKAPDDGFFIEMPRGVLAIDYPGRPRRSAALVLRGGGGLTPHYLAFSPAMAAELGWRPAERGLFAWEDGDRDRMVESLYWRDGWPTGSESRWRDELCGEGWLVLAHPKAMARLNPIASMQYLMASRDVEGREASTPSVDRRERVVGGTEGLRRPTLGLLEF
jgi:hypothetical protein